MYVHLKLLTNVQQLGQKKARETGREIEHKSILRSLAAIPASLEVIRPKVDFFCEIENNLTYSVKDGINFNRFEQIFSQTCAWKPGMRGKQKMATVTYTPKEANVINSFSLRKAKQIRSPFSVLLSSEENNRSEERNFYGKFSHIREALDYSFHSHYTFERQKLHDAIITDMLNEAYIRDENGNVGTIAANPWIVFTAGAMGAGKSHTLRVLVEQKRFPLPAFVIVDPDEIRRLLPEYHMYIAVNPELAGELTRKEVCASVSNMEETMDGSRVTNVFSFFSYQAGYISEVLTLAALQGGKNVLQDGSLRDHTWYQVHFRKLKEEFPQVRQAIIHVTAPRRAILARATVSEQIKTSTVSRRPNVFLFS